MRIPLLLLVLLLVGCSSASFEGEIPLVDVSAGDVTDARAKWNASGVESYSMVLTRNCFCPEDWRGPFAVRVENGAVVSVDLNGESLPTERALSVDALLDLLDDALDSDAASVRAAFDTESGVPRQLWVDYNVQMADEEIGYTVEGLRPR